MSTNYLRQDADNCGNFGLRDSIYDAANQIDRLRADLAQRTAERDEARRELCHYKYRSIMDECPDAITAPQLIARNRGWDCFKEEVKP
jgi:hypothetical protein